MTHEEQGWALVIAAYYLWTYVLPLSLVGAGLYLAYRLGSRPGKKRNRKPPPKGGETP